jgi:hypothetical protein
MARSFSPKNGAWEVLPLRRSRYRGMVAAQRVGRLSE